MYSWFKELNQIMRLHDINNKQENADIFIICVPEYQQLFMTGWGSVFVVSLSLQSVAPCTFCNATHFLA